MSLNGNVLMIFTLIYEGDEEFVESLVWLYEDQEYILESVVKICLVLEYMGPCGNYVAT